MPGAVRAGAPCVSGHISCLSGARPGKHSRFFCPIQAQLPACRRPARTLCGRQETWSALRPAWRFFALKKNVLPLASMGGLAWAIFVHASGLQLARHSHRGIRLPPPALPLASHPDQKITFQGGCAFGKGASGGVGGRVLCRSRILWAQAPRQVFRGRGSRWPPPRCRRHFYGGTPRVPLCRRASPRPAGRASRARLTGQIRCPVLPRIPSAGRPGPQAAP